MHATPGQTDTSGSKPRPSPPPPCVKYVREILNLVISGIFLLQKRAEWQL